MLPVYSDLTFDKIIEKGGRNRPIVVFVHTQDKLMPFVVKPFKTEHIEEHHSVANEVFGSILAREFDLPTPRPALFEFNEDFQMTIPHESEIELSQRDHRIQFGCALLKGAAQFIDSMPLSLVKKSIDLDDLFAFDLLIRNGDRNLRKSNILIYSNESWLIDHEYGFKINERTVEKIQSLDIDLRWHIHHISYAYLTRLSKQKKGECFNSFAEYLRNLNVNVLDSYANQLKTCGYDLSFYLEFKKYLEFMKHNSTIFVHLLKRLIS